MFAPFRSVATCEGARGWRGWVAGAGTTPGGARFALTAAPRVEPDIAKLVNGPAWYSGAHVQLLGHSRVNGHLVQWALVPAATNDGSQFSDAVAGVWSAGGHSYAIGFAAAGGKAAARTLGRRLLEGVALVGAQWLGCGRMPLQNRVTPFSELVADPARGLLYGNRGCLHDGSGRIRRMYATRRWIACQLEFRGWQRGPEAAARAVHGALLPRRGDRVRRRPPAVRPLPPRRLRPPGRALARAASRPGRCRRDRPPAPGRTRRSRDAHAAAPRGGARRAA